MELDIVHEGTFSLIAAIPNIVEQFHLEIGIRPQPYSNSRHIISHTVHNNNNAAVVVKLHRKLRRQRPLAAIDPSDDPYFSNNA